MPRRPALVTQADIARVIRALQDAGLTVARVVIRGDSVAVETTDAPCEGSPVTEPQELETWPADIVM